MRKIILFFVVIIFSVNVFSQAPNWAWAKSGGGISNDYSNATCTDANGNIYITGTFQGSTITFGSYTLYNVGTGKLDIFVVKYDAGGNVLWAKSGGGTGDDYAYGISADANGNVFITGFFFPPSLTFGTITLTHVDSTGYNRDIFIAKFDSSGSVLWANSIISSGYEFSYAICSDANGNAYITGMFGYNTNMILGNDTLICRGAYDIFIAKYDAGGNILWARSAGGQQSEGGYGICTDLSGSVYITGYFQHDATFGSDTLTGYGYVDIFLAKYDTNGNKLWAKTAIGIGAGLDWNFSAGITADAGSNVYITGHLRYSIIFGNDTLGNAGNRSIFIAKYDSSGNAIWGRSPGGTNSDYGSGISSDANGNIFVTGYFGSSFLNFGGIPVLNANVGYTDIFVAQYDTSGNALWATNIDGQDNDIGMGICTGTGGAVYVTGYFGSYTINFGSTTLTNNGSNDIFLAKLSNLVGINESISSGSDIFISPNPATSELIVRSSEFGDISELAIYSILGEKIYSQPQISNFKFQTVDISQLLPGVYFVTAIDNKANKITRKFIKM